MVMVWPSYYSGDRIDIYVDEQVDAVAKMFIPESSFWPTDIVA